MKVTVGLPDEGMRARLAPSIDGDVDLVVWHPGDAAIRVVIDLLVLPYAVTWGLLKGLGDQVRHIQSQFLGYDAAVGSIPSGVTFSNAVGVHEAPTAEMAMTLILASQRGWPAVGRNQDAQAWESPMWPGLIGKRVLLIGVGGIGAEFEKRVAGFGIELTRVARTARDGVQGIDELHALLPNADIVVLAIPLTEQTRGLVNDAFLDQLPAGALVVNVSRGPIVDTDALVSHVRSGAVRSALDVVDPEPLPQHHPLWSLPGSLISPHQGGAVQSMSDRVDSLVLEQIKLLARGERPKDIVIDEKSL